MPREHCAEEALCGRGFAIPFLISTCCCTQRHGLFAENRCGDQCFLGVLKVLDWGCWAQVCLCLLLLCGREWP